MYIFGAFKNNRNFHNKKKNLMKLPLIIGGLEVNRFFNKFVDDENQ